MCGAHRRENTGLCSFTGTLEGSQSRLNVVLNLFNKIKKTQNFQLERGRARATGPKLNATLQFLASGSFQDITRFYVVPQTFANI